MITSTRLEGVLLELANTLDIAIEAGPDAYKVERAGRKLLASLEGAALENHGQPIVIEMHDSLFVHRDLPLMKASLEGRSIITFLRVIGAGGLALEDGMEFGDVVRLLKVCLVAFEHGINLDVARQQLLNNGVTKIGILGPHDDHTWSLAIDKAAGELYHAAGFELEAAQPVHQEVAEVIEVAITQAANGKAVAMSDARTASEHIHEASRRGFSDLFQLGERPEYDAFTVQHSLRVALLATYVADWLGAPREILTELGAAALMHDVGKGRVPDEILYKPDRLDQEERRVIAQHPELGAEILLDSPDVGGCALGAAWGHHMRHDGRGYPQRRQWFETSPATSLIQVCDVFEALTARRPYKPPYSPSRAFRILYSDPGAFDPQILSAFTRALGLYPPGRFIVLSDGRIGRVLRSGAVLDRPIVRTVPDNEDVDLGAPENAEISVSMLLEEPDFVERAVAASGGRESHENLAAEPEEYVVDNSIPLPTFDGPPDGPAVDHSGGDDATCGNGDDCRLC